MTKTYTFKGKVSDAAKAELERIIAESGRDEADVVGEAVERVVFEDYWIKETQARLDHPDSERFGYSSEDMEARRKARLAGDPLPPREAKLLSEL